MKSRKTVWAAVLITSVAGAYLGWMAYCAHRNLVTLDVRNMDVRQVVKKIERQTWESVSVDKGVEGKVTLNVRRRPLEAVLRMIGEQTFSRSLVIYPLYSNDKSLSVLQQALRGEVDPATHGWTNFQTRMPGGMFGPGGPGGFMMGPGGAPFGRGMAGVSANQSVSLNIVGKDVAFTTFAFNRFAQARVVAEDGTDGSVNLTLKKSTIHNAVAQFAKSVRRKWTTLYALQGFDFGRSAEFAGGPGERRGPREGRTPASDDDFRPRGPGRPDMAGGNWEELRRQREKLEEELKQALPFDERKKLEAAQQEREQQMQEFANLTPEQRAQRFGQMNGAQMSQMQRDRLLGSTPEQRAQMNRMRGPSGGGGPGGPPR